MIIAVPALELSFWQYLDAFFNPHPLPAKAPQQTNASKRMIALLVAFTISLFIPVLLSVVGFFLSLWVVVPAPTFSLLPLGIGMLEVSLWLIAVNTRTPADPSGAFHGTTQNSKLTSFRQMVLCLD